MFVMSYRTLQRSKATRRTSFAHGADIVPVYWRAGSSTRGAIFAPHRKIPMGWSVSRKSRARVLRPSRLRSSLPRWIKRALRRPIHPAPLLLLLQWSSTDPRVAPARPWPSAPHIPHDPTHRRVLVAFVGAFPSPGLVERLLGAAGGTVRHLSLVTGGR